jgi:hypothetical protein
MKIIRTKRISVIYIVLFGVLILSTVLFIDFVNRDNESSPVALGSFLSNDGRILGNLFVKYTPQQLISDLYIRDESNELLFEMNRRGIYNFKNGKVILVSSDFYGYKIALKSSEEIIVNIFTNGGRDIGDGTTIYWDYKDEMFKVLGP